MKLGKLDHVNIRTANLDSMVSWYEDILGMRSGDRPPFPFPGAWLYVDGDAAVHLIEIESEPTNGSDLQLEHFALQAEGFDQYKRHFDDHEVRYDEIEVPGIGITQLNIWDPDGNHIHIDFDTGASDG